MTLEAAIFDCDGTLVDSERLTHEVLVAFAGEIGVPIGLDEAEAEFTGGKMADVVAALERRRGCALPPDFVPEFRKRMTAAFHDRLEPIAGARELLDSLVLPRCVASSGPREKIELSLTLTGLRRFFGDHIYSAYEVGCWKPDPGLFLHAAAAMGVAPERCAVVEDSLPGIQAGIAAGMRVYAYAPGHSGLRELPNGVTRIERLAELREALIAPGSR